jgi:hypothetical protein
MTFVISAASMCRQTNDGMFFQSYQTELAKIFRFKMRQSELVCVLKSSPLEAVNGLLIRLEY